jgi:hypothetical protein
MITDNEDLSLQDRHLRHNMWLTAAKLGRKLQAIREAGYTILDNQTILAEKDIIVVDEVDKRVGIHSGNCFMSIFDWNSWDYDSVKDVEAYFANSFTVVKPLKHWPKPGVVTRARIRRRQEIRKSEGK